jgi:hypothetical protein
MGQRVLLDILHQRHGRAMGSPGVARANSRFPFAGFGLQGYAMRRPSPLPPATLLLWASAFLFGAMVLADPAPPAAPSVNEIVQKAIARDDLRRDHREMFEADQTILTERLDLEGKVLAAKTVHTIHHPTREISFSTDTMSNSTSSSLSTPSAPGHPDQDTVKAQHIMAVMNLGKLAPHFTETVTGSATIQSRDCYVVSYRPKPGQPADNREEKVVNNVAGKFWIAKDNYDILQSEGSLVGPVTVAFIAAVTRMDFKFHSQVLANGEVGPGDFSVDMAIHAPFYDFRQLQVNSLAHWRPRS